MDWARRLNRRRCFVVVALSFLAITSSAQVNRQISLTTLSSVPVGFEENLGQAQAEKRFTYTPPGSGFVASFVRGKIELVFDAPNGSSKSREIVRITLPGSTHSVPEGIDTLSGVTHYYAGNDPTRWITNVRQFRQICYPNIYPSVDLVFYSNHGQLEFDLKAAPGADLSSIRLKVDGAVLKRHGSDISLVMPSGRMAILKHPNVYQREASARRRVSAEYFLIGRSEATFRLGSYDKRRPLVIDPGLIYSAYSGIAAIPFAIAVDSAGAAYVTGQSANPADGTTGVIVLKFDPTGANLVYTVRLSGSHPGIGPVGDQTIAAAQVIAVDSAGNAYIAGTTLLTDFPTKNA